MNKTFPYLVAASFCLPALAIGQVYAARSELRFNFSSQSVPGAVQVTFNDDGGAPRFDAATGYGFVDLTDALPARPVHVDAIGSTGQGFVISEPAFFAEKGFEKDHYNNYGMAFRVKASPGAYAIRVRTSASLENTNVSVSGMQASRLGPGVFWDAASLLPNRTRMSIEGRQWSYRYVNGRDFLDIEIEPKRVNTPVGVDEIVITPIAADSPSSPATCLTTTARPWSRVRQATIPTSTVARKGRCISRCSRGTGCSMRTRCRRATQPK